METPLQTPLLAPCSCSPRGRAGWSAQGLPTAKLCPSTGAGGEERAGSEAMAHSL